MNYAILKKIDIANGVGVRVSLFVSGCRHHCANCFNPETWDFNYGELFDKKVENEIIEALRPDYIKGFSVLGGDPFEPENHVVVSRLVQKIKKKEYPKKSIWCYTGYNFETDLLKKSKRVAPEDNRGYYIDSIKLMLRNIDVLVDGEFEEKCKIIDLRFRGSTNQRIIDVQKSLKQNKVVLWEDNKKWEEL